jgi:hypothetical protein
LDILCFPNVLAATPIFRSFRNIGVRLGARAKESVREKFLMSRLLEDWLDLLITYERPVN